MELEMKKQIYVIVPAYNEEKNISHALADLLKYNYQVVVVDDGSSDKTYQICQRFPVIVLHHAINRGQGAALQTGTEYALREGADIIVHFDGDGQFLANEIEFLITPVLSGCADIGLGSRFYADKRGLDPSLRSGQAWISADSNMPVLKKYIILPVARIINWLLTGVKLSDAHCGFRAMNREAAKKITITQDGMSHNTEIVAQIKKYQLKFKEVPVTVIYHKFGQGVGGGVRILKELLMGKIIK